MQSTTVKIDQTTWITIAITTIALVALIYLVRAYVFLPAPAEQENTWYEVAYLHVSGHDFYKKLYLPTEGVNIQIALCDGMYVAYDANSDRAKCNSILIYGATEILGYKQIK